jgi:preprotein translocase subunit YajC
VTRSMGRFTTSLIAISVVLVAFDIDCCQFVVAQEGNPAQIGAPPEPVPGTSADAGSQSSGSGVTGAESVEASRTPASAAPKSFGEAFFNNPLNLVLLAFVAFYVFLMFLPKPGRKEQKLLQERLSNLKKNDRVVLHSGIHGVVANIHSESGTVTLRVDESSNAKLTVDRTAIRSVEA